MALDIYLSVLYFLKYEEVWLHIFNYLIQSNQHFFAAVFKPAELK